jgi:hypothetical protein
MEGFGSGFGSFRFLGFRFGSGFQFAVPVRVPVPKFSEPGFWVRF